MATAAVTIRLGLRSIRDPTQVNCHGFCRAFDKHVALTPPPRSRQIPSAREAAHRTAAQQMPLYVEGVVDSGCVSRKRFAAARFLQPCIFHSRLRMLRCGFSARLFSRRSPGRCRSARSLRLAGPYPSLSLNRPTQRSFSHGANLAMAVCSSGCFRSVVWGAARICSHPLASKKICSGEKRCPNLTPKNRNGFASHRNAKLTG